MKASYELEKIKGWRISMINAITSVASNAYASLPTLRLDTPSNIIKKTTAVAIPAIALVALANLSEATVDVMQTARFRC